MKAALSLFVLGVVSSLAVYGQTPAAKPNFSGTWIFNPKKSTLKVPPPSSMTLTIEQADPQIHFARTQVYHQQSFDWKLQTVTDSDKDLIENSPEYVTYSRVHWDGNALVLDQKIVGNDGTTVTDRVTYTVTDDGKSLQALETQSTVGGNGATVNKWMYDKRAQ